MKIIKTNVMQKKTDISFHWKIVFVIFWSNDFIIPSGIENT